MSSEENKEVKIESENQDSNPSLTAAETEIKFKPKKKRQLRRRRSSENSDDEENLKEVSLTLEEMRELQSLRKRPNGVSVIGLTLGKSVSGEEEVINMAAKKKVFFKYSEEDVTKALDDIRHSVCSIRGAERKYNVPHSTLINKLKGATPETRKMGPQTILTIQEEDLLERWIIANAKKGIPLNKNSLFETVSDIIKSDNRPNPFTNNCPGEKWFHSFLRRHKNISRRHAECINAARAQVTEEAIQGWHEGIKQHLEELGCLDILDDPSRIINSDETGFETNPKTGLVLGPKGMNNFYQVTSGSEKEQITVLFTISANGEIYPPMIVYPYERIPAEIARHTPRDWVIGRSKSGWMTGQCFHSYVCNTFLPLLKGKNVQLPVLYFVDGHRSHLTYNVSKFCSENGIILFALYPNATHILQPADVALFKPLKKNWKDTVYEWKRTNNNKNVTKPVFSSLLEKAIAGVSDKTVQKGFRKCGLYPFDVKAIDFTKCISHDTRKVDTDSTKLKVKPADFRSEHLLYLESTMPPGRTAQFRKTLTDENGEWNGDIAAKELFYVWKKLRDRCFTEPSKTFPESTEETSEDIIIHAGKSDMNNIPGRSDGLLELEDELLENKENRPEELTAPIESHEKITPEKVAAINIIQNVPLRPPQRSISSSFLDHVYWPEKSPEKKESKRKTDRLPYATTSTRWLKFYEDKEYKKKVEEESKKKKALERKRKREDKEKAKVNKSSKKLMKKKVEPDTDSEDLEEWNESGTSGEDVSDEWDENAPEKGEFLVVGFPGKKKVHNYVCVVQNIIKDELEVQALTPTNEDGTVFKIIDKDVSFIDRSQIVKKLPSPEIITSGERLKYQFLAPVL